MTEPEKETKTATRRALSIAEKWGVVVSGALRASDHHKAQGISELPAEIEAAANKVMDAICENTEGFTNADFALVVYLCVGQCADAVATQIARDGAEVLERIVSRGTSSLLVDIVKSRIRDGQWLVATEAGGDGGVQ